MYRLQIAIDAGADFDRFHCLKSAGILLPLDHLAAYWLTHGHFRWRRWGSGRLLLSAGCHEEQQPAQGTGR